VTTPNYGIGLPWNSFIDRNLPHRGFFFVGGVPNPEPGGRGPPRKNNPQNSKLINFGGCSSGGVLFLPLNFGGCSSGGVRFLWIPGLATTQQRNLIDFGGCPMKKRKADVFKKICY